MNWKENDCNLLQEFEHRFEKTNRDSFCSVRDIACRLPGELDLVAVGIGTLSLRVNTFDLVSVFEVPATGSLRLIKSEVAFKE